MITIKIIAIRYAGRLKLSLDVDEKLLTHTILKMSFAAYY